MIFSNTILEELASISCEAATEAGSFIMSQRGTQLEVDLKKGGESYGAQVVTAVDRGSQEVILKMLASKTEKFQLAVLSEELPDDGGRFRAEAFWCIDPLDGTLPFIEGRNGFAVSIALVEKSGRPLLGVIHDPVEKCTYASFCGGGVSKNGVPFDPLGRGEVTPSPLTIVADESIRSHDAYTNIKHDMELYASQRGLSGIRITEGDGAAMNVCGVLEATPACYFKFPKKQKGGGCLWDFAASACIMSEAGGVVSQFSGALLNLNRQDTLYMNDCGVIYATDARLAKFIEGLSVSDSI